MPKLPIISVNRAVKCFEKIGYQVIRQRGSHVRMRHKSNSTKQPLTITTAQHSYSSHGTQDFN